MVAPDNGHAGCGHSGHRQNEHLLTPHQRRVARLEFPDLVERYVRSGRVDVRGQVGVSVPAAAGIFEVAAMDALDRHVLGGRRPLERELI